GLSWSTGVRPVEHGVQQDVAAGGQVRGLGVLDLIVADPVDARHKDHRGGRDPRHIDGVGRKYQNSLTSTSRPIAEAASSQPRRKSRSICVSTASSGWRKSTVKNT